jgi:hypothetical protein
VPKIGPHSAFLFQPQGGSALGNLFTAFPLGLSIGSVGRATVAYQLTTAQLLALGATPVQLVPAPGVPPKGFGRQLVLLPVRLRAEYIFNATAFTLGNADNVFQIEYTGKAVSLIQAAAAGLVDQVADRFVSIGVPIAVGNEAFSAAAGLGLEVNLTGTTAALTLGDGSVVLTLTYDVVVLV